jgi:hypothetical protein
LISRVCEEFHCTPPQAVDVLERCESLVFDILELRAYANTKQACDDADASDGKIKPPKGPLSDMVYQIEYDLLQARHAQMTGE